MTATLNQPELSETKNLGIGILVAEADGGYELVAAVSTLREAREITAGDFARRMRLVANGDEPMCPTHYAVWVQRGEGEYIRVTELQAE